MVEEDKGTETERIGGKNGDRQSGDPDGNLGLIVHFRVLLGHLVMWPLPNAMH